VHDPIHDFYLSGKQESTFSAIMLHPESLLIARLIARFILCDRTQQSSLVYLKKFGQVKVFRRSSKNETPRYYIMYVPNKEALFLISREDFEELHSIHWGIECYHRSIKQVCGIELFMVRTSEAIKTHL